MYRDKVYLVPHDQVREAIRRGGTLERSDEAVSEYEEAERGLGPTESEAVAAEKQARLDGYLSAAREAKANGSWNEVVAQCALALALDTGEVSQALRACAQEAEALKREAEEHLVPVLEIVAVADGREVNAQVGDGSNTWKTPVPVKLKKGDSYTFTVSYKSDQSGRQWEPVVLRETADWTGYRPRRVTLRETQGPVNGQSRTVPEFGMELMPVEAPATTKHEKITLPLRGECKEADGRSRALIWSSRSNGARFYTEGESIHGLRIAAINAASENIVDAHGRTVTVDRRRTQIEVSP